MYICPLHFLKSVSGRGLLQREEDRGTQGEVGSEGGGGSRGGAVCCRDNEALMGNAGVVYIYITAVNVT